MERIFDGLYLNFHGYVQGLPVVNQLGKSSTPLEKHGSATLNFVKVSLDSTPCPSMGLQAQADQASPR
jgi:hypothetical protein